MQIVSGIMAKPVKMVLYGPEGIGKSSFAAEAPRPLFIDTEGSTTRLAVDRMMPLPSSLAMLTDYVRYVIQNPIICKTLVVDTADWAQKLMIDAVCAQNQKSGIEDFGYGKGYSYVFEEFGRFLNLLDQVWERGVNIIVTAHAAMRKFEQPDEMGAYDRWELKLINAQKCNVAAMLKEWADVVLFANYETIVVKTEDKKAKAQGGRRVMYTSHHPCWDAKNRFGLPEKLPLDFQTVAQCFLYDDPSAGIALRNSPAQVQQQAQAQQMRTENPTQKAPPVNPTQVNGFVSAMNSMNSHSEQLTQLDPGIPQKLRQLMAQNNVSEAEICRVVAQRGYYPENTPIRNYDPQFVEGVLVGAWDQMCKMIKGE